jgi:hypothetical protein
VSRIDIAGALPVCVRARAVEKASLLSAACQHTCDTCLPATRRGWPEKSFPWVDPGRLLYKYVHSLHHKSYNPGPWSGLAMHPVGHSLTPRSD